MKPGETTLSRASSVVVAGMEERSPIATIASPRTPMSPRYHGAPVPSRMRPFAILRSSVGVVVVAQDERRTTAATDNGERRTENPLIAVPSPDPRESDARG